MKKIQLKKALLLVALMIYGNTSFANQEKLDRRYPVGVEQSIQNLHKRIDDDPTLNKGLQQLFDTHVKDEATRKRECARLAAMTNGKLGFSPETAKKDVDEIISGKHEFPMQSRQSGKSDVWNKYGILVGKLERSLLHIGSLNSLDKSELDQVVLNHDVEWLSIYNSLKNSGKMTPTDKSALGRANGNHQQIMSILQGQKRDQTTMQKILPYVRKIKQDLVSFPNFTLADKNAKIHSTLNRFQAYYGKQTNLDRSQIDALLAKKRKNSLERVKKSLRSVAMQKQLEEQYQSIATIKEQLANPLLGMLREQLDCD